MSGSYQWRQKQLIEYSTSRHNECASILMLCGRLNIQVTTLLLIALLILKMKKVKNY